VKFQKNFSKFWKIQFLRIFHLFQKDLHQFDLWVE
jgi:hypothetical protein